MTTLLIATRNRHKLEEIGAILGAGFRFLSLQDFPEAPHGFLDGHEAAGRAGELLGHVEGLGQEALDLACAGDGQLLVLAQLLNT